MANLIDWLDHNDYGYPLGLLTLGGCAGAAILQWWLLAAFLLAVAFVLCWAFG
jgi:hypothetical protein